MSSCFMIGLHTGRGEHPELANPNFQIRNTDEEATFTWAGFNIISQRVASYSGCPSTGQFFNKTVETILDRSAPVAVPMHFIILLECARFSNRVSKTTCASLEENRGISHHIVDMFEEEFDKVQRLLFPGISELDYFTLLSTLLEVQTFYFMPVPDFSAEIFKRNVLKATILAAACITLNVLLSPYMKDMPIHAKNAIIQDAIVAVRSCSIHDGDLPSRASKMIESYWSVNHLKPPLDIPMKDVSQFSHRLGTSFSFDYIRRWKRDIEASRSSVTNVNASIDISSIQPENAQLIDWDAFMDDFDWSFTPDYLNPT
ncbi:c6 zinc finger domain containing protein [Niveomyces insectorum RCEF 264]|uniref:C6 zinc finger domain containing protein n=1 Tax=Niveomyces insectorum RCEF 264 TaxID=1081102 RepID=A0A167ZWW2_9HYPO|nr:c6 zinc finger domain containing protein [Niveomyces insectorum RCEF 264]